MWAILSHFQTIGNVLDNIWLSGFPRLVLMEENTDRFYVKKNPSRAMQTKIQRCRFLPDVSLSWRCSNKDVVILWEMSPFWFLPPFHQEFSCLTQFSWFVAFLRVLSWNQHFFQTLGSFYASTFVVGTHTISIVHISSCCKESLSRSSFTHTWAQIHTLAHRFTNETTEEKEK